MQNTFYFLSTQEYVTNLQNNSINDTIITNNDSYQVWYKILLSFFMFPIILVSKKL